LGERGRGHCHGGEDTGDSVYSKMEMSYRHHFSSR
jgi:hypothetical protein